MKVHLTNYIMVKVSDLIKYREYLDELEGTNSIYPKVKVIVGEEPLKDLLKSDPEMELPDKTPVTERWYNGRNERFHEYTFQIKDINDVKKRIYDKLRHAKLKEQNNEQ